MQLARQYVRAISSHRAAYVIEENWRFRGKVHGARYILRVEIRSVSYYLGNTHMYYVSSGYISQFFPRTKVRLPKIHAQF